MTRHGAVTLQEQTETGPGLEIGSATTGCLTMQPASQLSKGLSMAARYTTEYTFEVSGHVTVKDSGTGTCFQSFGQCLRVEQAKTA